MNELAAGIQRIGCGIARPIVGRLGEAVLVHVTVVGIGPATIAVSVLIAALIGLWLLHRRSPNP